MAFGELRQGHPTSSKTDWRSKELTQAHLPHTIQMGEEFGFKRETNIHVNDEILWQNELSRLIVKAFQPKTYNIGTKNMQLVAAHASALVAHKVDDVFNALVGGKSSLLLSHHVELV